MNDSDTSDSFTDIYLSGNEDCVNCLLSHENRRCVNLVNCECCVDCGDLKNCVCCLDCFNCVNCESCRNCRNCEDCFCCDGCVGIYGYERAIHVKEDRTVLEISSSGSIPNMC